MPSLPDSRQWRREADLLDAADARLPQDGRDLFTAMSWTPERDERIRSQPRAFFRPPTFVRQTATPEQFAELEAILGELWQVNEEYVGEYTKEVEVYLSVSDLYRGLVERTKAWCEVYFAARMRRVSPKDNGDPARRFVRLVAEYDQILGRICVCDNAIAYIYLAECGAYVPWLLCHWATRREFEPVRWTTLPIRIPRQCTPTTPFEGALHEMGMWEDQVLAAVAIVWRDGDQDRMKYLARHSHAELTEYCFGLACDIAEMRPFLVKNYDPLKTMIKLGGEAGMILGWEWSTRSGIGSVLFFPKERDFAAFAVTRAVSFDIKCDAYGVLIQGNAPWASAAEETRLIDVNPMAINAYVIELLHNKLFSFYDKIDFDRIRRRTETGVAAGESEIEVVVTEEQVALSCQDIAAQCEVDANEQQSLSLGFTQRIPHIRLSPLLNLLEGKFGCEVRQGKGSEVTVFRTGGKKFRLGCHQKWKLVASPVVYRLLRTVGIPLAEWYAVARGS